LTPPPRQAILLQIIRNCEFSPLWRLLSGTDAPMLGRLFALFTVAGSLLSNPATAHIVAEEPWHPAAASYRTMLFIGNLQPIVWDLILEAYDRPLQAASSDRAPKTFFETVPAGAQGAIAKAIGSNDRQALYETATRAVSQLVRKALAEAADSLAVPGRAHQKVLEAQAIYRAVGDFVVQADPEAGKRLGLAWLQLTSSVGSAGVLGSGVVTADRPAFDDAHKAIESYLVANFEPQKFAVRRNLTPLPETVVAAKGEVKVAPWLPPGSNLNDQEPLPKLVLNFEERKIKERDLPLVAYGDMLFDSPFIFGEPARSLGIACSTCHNRGEANQTFFIPGLGHQKGAIDVRGSFFNPLFNDRRRGSLDIPSLRGLRFTGPYGRDGRFGSLRDFVRNVIVSEFAGEEPTPFMLDALVAYMLEFDFLPNSRLDPQGRLTDKASAAAKRGEKLFRKPFAQMDGKSCATCHVPSANFLDRQAHNIGSTNPSYEDAREASYDTPTLLGTKFTAPYFHNGSQPTLASVVDWFDSRYKLKLSKAERADLTAYLEAVGDADEPHQKFEGRETKFRLDWEELTTFASTFDTLLPIRDTKHAELMLATVAGDLAADASGMVNAAAKPKVYELADILANIRKSVLANDWAAAEKRWATFKELQAKYDEEMY
jgi:cytochrome c peroxidase